MLKSSIGAKIPFSRSMVHRWLEFWGLFGSDDVMIHSSIISYLHVPTYGTIRLIVDICVPCVTTYVYDVFIRRLVEDAFVTYDY